ncbi:MAG: helicase associated domain-containing protein [Tomitella sp.]|nr:helicase associated domain-containing protein [Tomitella sp.]
MNPHDPLKVFRRYVRDHGDGNVPRRYITDSGYRLGEWVAKTRRRIRDGRTPTERRNELVAAGFLIDPPTHPTRLHQQQWNIGIEHLCAYVHTHGNADVPARYTSSDGYPLGPWVASRRKHIRRHGTAGTPDRDQQLADLDFTLYPSQRRD